jgi:hypothetical protein
MNEQQVNQETQREVAESLPPGSTLAGTVAKDGKKKSWRQVKKEREALRAQGKLPEAPAKKKAQVAKPAAPKSAPKAAAPKPARKKVERSGADRRKSAGPFPSELASLVALKKRKVAELAQLDKTIQAAAQVLKKVQR